MFTGRYRIGPVLALHEIDVLHSLFSSARARQTQRWMNDGKSTLDTKCNIHRHYREKGLDVGDFESGLSSETLSSLDQLHDCPTTDCREQHGK